jgi:hypothetical protein
MAGALLDAASLFYHAARGGIARPPRRHPPLESLTAQDASVVSGLAAQELFFACVARRFWFN